MVTSGALRDDLLRVAGWVDFLARVADVFFLVPAFFLPEAVAFALERAAVAFFFAFFAVAPRPVDFFAAFFMVSAPWVPSRPAGLAVPASTQAEETASVMPGKARGFNRGAAEKTGFS